MIFDGAFQHFEEVFAVFDAGVVGDPGFVLLHHFHASVSGFRLEPLVHVRPADAGKVPVAVSHGFPFGVCRFAVVGMIAFLCGATLADAVCVESRHGSCSIERLAAAVAIFLCEEGIGHDMGSMVMPEARAPGWFR